MGYRDGRCGVLGCKHRRSSWTVAGELFRLWLWVWVIVIVLSAAFAVGTLIGQALS